jgi:hypothetical protein
MNIQKELYVFKSIMILLKIKYTEIENSETKIQFIDLKYNKNYK